MQRFVVIVVALLWGAVPAIGGEVFTIHDAIEQAVKTNPGVGEAAANRRATEAELRQQQGTLLPQVRLQADAGPEKLRRDINPAPTGNGDWQRGREVSVVLRQTLFDGFTSINEVWRQSARVDAAAYRVHERTELIALDAAEAYIDVTRYMRLVTLSQENLAAHRKIFSNVQARYSGGRSGEGDVEQARERVQGAEAALHEFRRSLEDARAKYRKTVGLEPFNVRAPGRLSSLPGSKDATLAVALKFNPTLRAAGADTIAAKYGFHSTAGAFMPNASLELRHLRGVDSTTYSGYRTEESAKVVLSWDIFRGGQDSWKRVEASERMIESTQREARLQRDAFESIDKAWSARTITNDRIAALARESDAARKVVGAYTKEYELGQRTLIDLLNAENGLFNTYVSLISARGVAVFADYQLLAAMGQLLDYLKTAGPPEAEPLYATPFIFPTKIPPILLSPPGPGPEPLKARRSDATELAPSSKPLKLLADRWPAWTVPVDSDAMARWQPTRHPEVAAASMEKAAREDNAQRRSSALSFAADVLKAPAIWPIKSVD
jgi:outer membrane protein, adhesin transport system